jgi:hypothetical protein
MQWQHQSHQQQQQQSHHDPLSVATTVWGVPGPAGGQHAPQVQQSMIQHAGGPGQSATVSGYGQQPMPQRPMGPASAAMGQFQRGVPNNMVTGAMFSDAGGGSSAMQKYNAYGVRQAGPQATGVPFSQHRCVH